MQGLITFERSDRDEKNETASSNVAAAAAAAGLADGGNAEAELGIAQLAPETARWDARIRGTAQLTEDLAVRCGSLMAGIA